MAKNWLAHPLLRGLDLDSESFFVAQHKILRQKPYLQHIYRDFYLSIKSQLPDESQRVIELGSGAGFMNELIPRAIRTDVFFHPFSQMVLDGISPPFPDDSLDAVVALNVFHHIPKVRNLLSSASRILRPGGRMVMVEPWVSAWSKKIYKYLHHEPLDWMADQWEFLTSGPVSGANQALPWIVFQRDRMSFEKEFPRLSIVKIQPMMPFRYILSGGVSSWIGLPGFLYQPVKIFEKLFCQGMDHWAMFALVVIEKVK